MVRMSANDQLPNQEGFSLVNIGAIAVIIAGFALIALGKENQTVTVIVGMAAGVLFGTHTNKIRGK